VVRKPKRIKGLGEVENRWEGDAERVGWSRTTLRHHFRPLLTTTPDTASISASPPPSMGVLNLHTPTYNFALRPPCAYKISHIFTPHPPRHISCRVISHLALAPRQPYKNYTQNPADVHGDTLFLSINLRLHFSPRSPFISSLFIVARTARLGSPHPSIIPGQVHLRSLHAGTPISNLSTWTMQYVPLVYWLEYP